MTPIKPDLPPRSPFLTPQHWFFDGLNLRAHKLQLPQAAGRSWSLEDLRK